MASPVILKPLAVCGGGYRPLLAILRAPAPANVRLIRGHDHSGPHTLSSIASDPVLLDQNFSTWIEALIAAARSEGGWEGKLLELNARGAV